MELKHCRNSLSWNAASSLCFVEIGNNSLQAGFKVTKCINSSLLSTAGPLVMSRSSHCETVMRKNIFQCFFIIPDFAHIRDMFLLPVELMSRLKRSSLCNVFEEVGIRNIWRELIRNLMFLCQEPYKQSCGMKMRRVETTNVVHVGVNVLSTT